MESGDDFSVIDELIEERSDSLLSAVKFVCKFYNKEVSEAVLYAGLPRGKALSPIAAVRILEQVGMKAGWVQRSLDQISDYLLPVVQACGDGRYCVILRKHTDKGKWVYDHPIERL